MCTKLTSNIGIWQNQNHSDDSFFKSFIKPPGPLGQAVDSFDKVRLEIESGLSESSWHGSKMLSTDNGNTVHVVAPCANRVSTTCVNHNAEHYSQTHLYYISFCQYWFIHLAMHHGLIAFQIHVLRQYFSYLHGHSSMSHKSGIKMWITYTIRIWYLKILLYMSEQKSKSG